MSPNPSSQANHPPPKTARQRLGLREQCLLLTRLANPNGIGASSPGLRGTSYPGSGQGRHRQPQRGCGCGRGTASTAATPSGLATALPYEPQGSSCLATLGFAPESLRDSPSLSCALRMRVRSRATRQRRRRFGPCAGPAECVVDGPKAVSRCACPRSPEYRSFALPRPATAPLPNSPAPSPPRQLTDS